jgi:colanic acid biosynthesis glycosyl transferase WcaI
MRIVVWGINYTPELTGIGPYNTVVCEYLAERGHDVAMVTGFRYYPEWEKAAEDSCRWFRSESIAGVNVHRCWLYVPKQIRALQRILHEASFVVSSLIRVLVLPRPDLYIVVSPPLLLGAAAAMAAFIKRTRFIFHVQDLQPDAALTLGMLKKRSRIAKVLYRLEAIAYSAATRVSTISPGILRMLRAKGVHEGKLLFCPNTVSLPKVLPQCKAFRQRQGIPDAEFIVLYSGNLGVKQGLSVLLDAAVILQQRDKNEQRGSRREIRFVIAGAGAQSGAIVDYVSKNRVRNVTLLPLQPVEAYHEMLIDADCCAITQHPGTGALFFPSKLLMTLAFGRAVLSIADEESDLAAAVREGGFGANIVSEAPTEVADMLEEWAERSDEIERMGRAGRVYVDRFEKTKVLAEFEAELLELQQQNAAQFRRITDASTHDSGSGSPKR